MRGATRNGAPETRLRVFQSTRPMRGATGNQGQLCAAGSISIHAPHAGRDAAEAAKNRQWQISIHAPHAGRDHSFMIKA